MLVCAGNDKARYDRDFANGGTTAVTVDLAARTGVDGFGNTDTLRNVEWVRGTQNADVMLGADSNDQFRGLAGADFFDGRGGFNTIDYSKDVSYGGILGVVVDFGTLTAKELVWGHGYVRVQQHPSGQWWRLRRQDDRRRQRQQVRGQRRQ